MRRRVPAILILNLVAIAQSSPQPSPKPESNSVTIPFTLDHNRVIIDVSIPLPDGTTQRVHAWVDNGNPNLYLSQRLASLTGGSMSCDGQLCSATPPVEMNIGGMTIPLGGRSSGSGSSGSGITEAKVPAGDAPIAPGMSAEINIPSTVLRNYDVLINFPDREFTIARSGILKFNGVKIKVIINSGNGLIQVPSQIENKKYNLGLNLGSPISFLSEELFDKLSAAHPAWPHMMGAIGPANTGELADELKLKLMRVERLQYGPLYLTDVAVAEFPKGVMPWLEKDPDFPSAGLVGSEALLNYRVGLDYAHSTIYFDIGRLFNVPDFDVIGLILRSEIGGRLTILGVADFDGKPSVDGVQAGDHLIAVDGIPVAGSTMGQVWSMLGGEPGKERKLSIERSGKQFTVVAKVQHFLGKMEEDDAKGKSRNK